MILSCVLWVSGYIYSNENQLHPIETSILRGFMIMLFSFIMCKYNKETVDVHVDGKKIIIRNIIFLMQAFIMAWVQFYLPLSVVHTIGSTGPLYVSIFAYLVGGEYISKKQLIGMTTVVLGLLLTINGRYLSHLINPEYTFESDFTYKSNSPETILLFSGLLIAFMVLWGYGVYVTNGIKASPFQVNFLFGLKLYLLSSFMYPVLIQNGQQIDVTIFYKGFLWTGVLFAFSEIFFVCGIMLSKNISLTIMLGSFTIVFAYFVGVVRYGEDLNPFCLTGSAVMVFGLYKMLFKDQNNIQEKDKAITD